MFWLAKLWFGLSLFVFFAGMVTKWAWAGDSYLFLIGYCLSVWSCSVLCCLDFDWACCCGRSNSFFSGVFIDVSIANANAAALLQDRVLVLYVVGWLCWISAFIGRLGFLMIVQTILTYCSFRKSSMGLHTQSSLCGYADDI
jgi:hypothetical protein